MLIVKMLQIKYYKSIYFQYKIFSEIAISNLSLVQVGVPQLLKFEYVL